MNPIRFLLPLLLIALTAHAADDPVDLAALTVKAETGDVPSQYQLAQRYAQGTDVAKDEAQALAWFKKAAERDHAGAQVQMGSIYSHGFGVKQDWAESIKWFRKAALQGDPVALHNLGLDYEYAHGVEKDEKQAANFYRLGAEQGQPRCQYNLARLYEDGRGVPQSNYEAALLQSLAADHENPNRIFGEAKAKEVIERRDKLTKLLTPEQQAELPARIKAYQARILIHPRRFGTANTGTVSRGWYIWHSFNPDTWQAVISRDPPGPTAEKWTINVLPWCTTYRHLTYGVRPDTLFPGERVNIFFDPDGKERRGFIDHFQDEICQMKGHGHFWQIKTIDNPANKFTATVMAGEKPLNPADPDREFIIDPKCAKWKEGKQVDAFPLTQNDHIYLTWCHLDGKNIVKLIADAASLDTLKKIETDRHAKELATTGLGGFLQWFDGDTAHLMLISNHWSQANQLKEGQTIRLSAATANQLPTGPKIPAKITFRKNRGTYGSGVNDILLQFANPADTQQAAQWLGGAGVRLFMPE